jgi:hypothetical protein
MCTKQIVWVTHKQILWVTHKTDPLGNTQTDPLGNTQTDPLGSTQTDPLGNTQAIFASQGLRFGSPFSPPLADLVHILRIHALIFHWLRLPVHVSNHKTFYTEHMLSMKCKQRWHRNALI